MAAACVFLSNLLLRPEAGARLAETLDADTARQWPLRGNSDITAGVQVLLDALAAEVPAADLEADYDRLFVGPGPMLACPYESVHRSREGLTFEAETLQVRMSYAAFGLRAPAFNKEPDDHLGL
ncbi:MAG: molecular chaperone TorD family protein, partial [Propionibacterium sp.]|nr:molecular chaperone TorD family protein [Propionibacterium sp.]